MNCQACDKPLSTYDPERGMVSCKSGHIWTLPEHADLPAPNNTGLTVPVLKPYRKTNRFPVWPLAAVPGVVALILELIH